MSRTVVLEALRKTSKGNLKYDATWYTDGRLKDIIDSAASPPPLPANLLIRSLERLQQSTDATDQRDGSSDHSPADGGSQVIQHNNSHNEESPQGVTNGLSSSYSDEVIQARERRSARIQVALLEYEDEIRTEAQERNQDRRKQMVQVSQQLEREARRDVTLLDQRTELQRRALWQKINDVNAESEENRERRLLHQQERHRLHLKRLDAKLKEAQRKKEQAEQERQRRKQAELQSFLESLAKVKGQIDEQAVRILQELDACPHQEQLAPKGNEIKELIGRLQAKADQLVQTARESKPSERAFQVMTVLIQKLMDLSNLSSGAIADAEKMAKEEEEMAKAEEEAARSAAAASIPCQVSQPAGGQVSGTGSRGVLSEMANTDSLTEYNKLQENLQNVQKSFEQLERARDMKTYCFDIRKAINTPVNAISAVSGSHFLSKLRHLQQLLTGSRVEVGTKMVSATNHPEGMAFCRDLLAKKIVKQGQEQVSSNYQSAFPFAAVAVGLWSQYPDVGDLILANFHQQCPFLVPYHMGKREDQTNEEYYKLLGYLYNSDGVIEKQDKYLKRMSGYTRLYAAILVSVPPPGCGQVNPFGREKAWQWLARLLNLEPQPDITATMLFDFLEVCGFALAETYKKQFFKLIQVLIQGYFPKIEAVTPRGSGGPVTRLKSYLQRCLQSHKFPPPAGLLPSSFWRS